MFIEQPIPAGKGKKGARSLVAGVGINDAPYITTYRDTAGKQHHCPYYQKWSGMLKRVYCPKLHAKSPTYAGCTIDPNWHYFMTFRLWVQKQNWQGKALDKDLLNQQNKHYGPNTCLFISQALNNLLCLCDSARGAYPLGVEAITQVNGIKFRASFRYYGEKRHLGQFDTIEDAATAYKQAKLDYIKELAGKERDPRVKQALLNLH